MFATGYSGDSVVRFAKCFRYKHFAAAAPVGVSCISCITVKSIVEDIQVLPMPFDFGGAFVYKWHRYLSRCQRAWSLRLSVFAPLWSNC